MFFLFGNGCLCLPGSFQCTLQNLCAQMLSEQMISGLTYEGTEEEKKARLFLATPGIDYDKLTPEEFVTQINILKKSEHLKSPNNQRGKAVPYQVHGKGNRKRRK